MRIKHKKLYCQIDTKQKKINGNGTDYNPVFQDTIFTIDTMQINLLSQKLRASKQNIAIEVIEQADLGKVNRRKFIDRNIVQDKNHNYNNTKPKERLYIGIKEPIDGWDIIQILYNNLIKKQYGTDIHPCLSTNMYLPVIISYVAKEGEITTQYFLYNYFIRLSTKGGFYYKYAGKTKLNICD